MVTQGKITNPKKKKAKPQTEKTQPGGSRNAQNTTSSPREKQEVKLLANRLLNIGL